MCRLLLVRSDREFAIKGYLEKFAHISKNCREYQGHGWGCAYLKGGKWGHYKNIKPIWEDELGRFGKTNLLIAHARSAFQDRGIKVENNMPFYDDQYVFIFNGELRGVKINEEGRIGAEKIFNFIKRFDKGDMLEALKKGLGIIQKKTRYIKAIDLIIADKENFYAASMFNEDPDYFTMHYKKTEDSIIVCSEPFDKNWSKIDNNSIKKFIFAENEFFSY